jgi:uncharacterized protein involved in exopolysaccharide biosynthesis
VKFARTSTREVVPEAPVAPIMESTWEDAEEDSSEKTLAYLRLLWERRSVLVRAAAIAFVVSTIIAFLIPAKYESTARLMPPDTQGASGFAAAAAALSGGAAGGGLSSLAGEYLGLKSTSDVFVGILSSRTVQDKLIEQFDLRKLYWDRRMEDARKDLAERTSLSIDRKSQIVTIGVSDRSPQRAAAMAGAYVAELNRLSAELSTSSARRERIFLEGRLQAVGQDLETAEKEFSQFASKNTAIDIKEQGKAMVGAAAELQGQMIAAQSQLEGLRQIYSDNNVRVRTVKARIDELQRQLEKIGGKGESSSTLPSRASDSMYPSIRKLPLLGVEFADLYRRTRVQEAVFETLTKEYEMAKVQEVKEIPTVRVLDVPEIPEKKSSPSRLFIILLGTGLGIAAVSVWVLGTDIWKRADASDPRKVFALEVLTTVSAPLASLTQNGSNQSTERGFWHRARQPKGEQEKSE